jgi:ATP-dependent RNA helicase DHX57
MSAGKMLVYGAMLGCLDPVLTVAAALTHGRPVFLSAPPDRMRELDAARAPMLRLAVTARSDHVALVVAFNMWVRAKAKGEQAVLAQV